jgi:hypothetical protein
LSRILGPAPWPAKPSVARGLDPHNLSIKAIIAPSAGSRPGAQVAPFGRREGGDVPERYRRQVGRGLVGSGGPTCLRAGRRELAGRGRRPSTKRSMAVVTAGSSGRPASNARKWIFRPAKLVLDKIYEMGYTNLVNRDNSVYTVLCRRGVDERTS